jgi:hypothetical protein
VSPIRNPISMNQLLKQLPVVKQLLAMRSDVMLTRAAADRQFRLSQEFFVTTLFATPKYADTKKLNHYEGQVFSQNGEDGIIAEIFSRIGSTGKTFVEFGAGDGSENNSAYLLLKGWSGYWFEGDAQNVNSIQSNFAELISEKRLIASREFFTMKDAAKIFERHDIPPEFDLLSIDIDRNTSWIWRALEKFRPRVCVVEYNPSKPPQDDWEIPYRADATWDGTLLYGAGLLALEKVGAGLGYLLVGCDLSGTNAFFVRNDLVADLFSEPFTARHHYEPSRMFLVRTFGHKKPNGLGASKRG